MKTVSEAKPAKRQHFLARFYLRNFAEPMFSDDICVYDLRNARWHRRTTAGVGWFPHLCSIIDMEGKRTDGFDQYLKITVEDPAAPALKKLALGSPIGRSERAAVALFIALTAARAQLAGGLLTRYVDGLGACERAELEAFERQWRDRIGKPSTTRLEAEFLKPSALAAVWVWATHFQNRLLKWEWHLVRTTRHKPFVTSDQPVFGQQLAGLNLRLVTFPVSSELALVVTDGGQFNEARCPESDARAMNRGTIERAREFIVACGESFPAYEHLKGRAGRS